MGPFVKWDILLWGYSVPAQVNVYVHIHSSVPVQVEGVRTGG